MGTHSERKIEVTTMKDLYIVGAGGLGREILNFILDMHANFGPRWNIKGFLDDTANPLGSCACDYGVAGTIKDYMPKKDDVLIMGIADPQAKKKLAAMLKNRGASFETVIFPGAYIGRHCEIGEGSVLYAGCGMTVNVKVGVFATILGCGIGHDTRIGDYCTISAFTHLMGRVHIGEGVFIGANAAIGPRIHVGDNAYICMGSMVMANVPPNVKIIGNPAKEIG